MPETNMRRTLLFGGTHAAFDADVLPADFYKHDASLTQAKELVSRSDGRLAGQVNSQGHDKPENLAQRNQAFRVTRRTFLTTKSHRPLSSVYRSMVSDCRKSNGCWQLRIYLMPLPDHFDAELQIMMAFCDCVYGSAIMAASQLQNTVIMYSYLMS
ncbi:YopJ family acetyltransferase [Pseudomonas corrugata]